MNRLSNRQVHPDRVSAIALAFLLLACLGVPVASRAATGRPTLRIVAPQQVALGEPIQIALRLQNAADLAGYEMLLLYDTSAAEFADARQLDDDVSRAGRQVEPLTVANMATGSAVGLYSCAVSCPSGTAPQPGAGASGDVALATVELEPLRPGALEIGFAAARFVDAGGDPLAVDMPARSIVVRVGPAGAGPVYPAPASPWSLAAAPPAPAGAMPSGALDQTGDGQVGQGDLAVAGLDWTSARELGRTPCGALADPSRDVNRDGCLDVADLQLLAARVAPERPGATTVTAPLTLTVNSSGDSSDARIGDGVCATSAGACTLRAAISEANRHPGPDAIRFNIPGAGVHTIRLTKELPILYDFSGGTTIDGYSQPGARPNTDPLASNAQISVELRGKGPSGFSGILIGSANNTVRGLSLYNFFRPIWIRGSGANDNILVGNFIGTDAAGVFRSTTTITDASGVYIAQGASRNHVGRPAPADRNVISGTARSGVALWYEGTNANAIVNNLVGYSPDGQRRLGNISHGIDINSSSAYNVVGGTAPGLRNVVCCSGKRGIEISHGGRTAHNSVIGNFVGTDLTGTSAPSWAYVGSFGIQLKDRVADNVVADNVVGNSRGAGVRVDEYLLLGYCCVGVNRFVRNRVGVSLSGAPIPNGVAGFYVTASNSIIGPGNVIAYNPVGIRVERDGSDKNRITRNAIFGNAGLGIDLAPIGGANQNDSGDRDGGPNQQLNFPVLQSASTQVVTGTACGGCTVELFAADAGAGKHGQGRTFVGATVAGPKGNFAARIGGVSAGAYITATAIDANGNTSEFSLNRQVQTARQLSGYASFLPLIRTK